MATQQIATTPSGPGVWLARVTSPLARPLAGRRFFPIWAKVSYRGRRSGRSYTTPVAVGASRDAFVIPLPFGAGTQWVRNVLAAGGCTVRWNGADYEATGPTVIGREEAAEQFSGLPRAMLGVAGLDEFLRLVRSAPWARPRP